MPAMQGILAGQCLAQNCTHFWFFFSLLFQQNHTSTSLMIQAWVSATQACEQRTMPRESPRTHLMCHNPKTTQETTGSTAQHKPERGTTT